MTDLLTSDDVAAELQTPVEAVMEMASQGQLPGFWMRGEWRVRRPELDAFITRLADGPSAVSVAAALAAFYRAQGDMPSALPAPPHRDDRLLMVPNGREQLVKRARASTTFCTAPWVHFLTVPDGSVLPCCMAKDAVRAPDGNGVNVRTTDPAEIWNGPEFKLIRQALLDGERIPHCATCYHNEAIGRSSYREKFNLDYFGDPGPSRRSSFVDRIPDLSDPLTASKPLFLDIRLGNICNLKCRMCGPGLSSQIEKDDVATAWVPRTADGVIGANVEDWPEARNLLAQIKDFVVDSANLELVGGEPTLNQAHLTILQHLVDEGLSHKVDVLMISNMTNANDHVYDLLSRFRTPTVHFSVEAIGPVNDYIRSPAKWAFTSEKLLSTKAKHPNLNFGVSPTFQAYNILDITDLFDWCVANAIGFTTGNILLYPEWLSVLVLPMPVRILAAERVETWIDRNRPVATVVSELTALINYLRDETRQASSAQIRDFIRFTNDLDRSRNQDIRQSLPELYALFTQHCPWDHSLFRHQPLPGLRTAS